MSSTEQTMREAIGQELADILYRQKAAVLCNERFRLLDPDYAQSDFKTMAEEDEKSLRLLESMIGSYGMRIEPRGSAVAIADLLIDVIAGETALPLERLQSYMMLKQNQQLGTHLLHKAIQDTPEDIKVSLAAFSGIYVTFTRHTGELNAYLERAGVAWIIGREPDAGLFSRAREAVSVLTGVVMNRIGSSADELSILSVLKLDHRKVETLFKEISGEAVHPKSVATFRQLKADLTAHSIAEEETVYSRFQNINDMKDLMTEARQDHADIRNLLDEVSDLQDDEEHFLDKLEELELLVKEHVEEEEGEVFKLIQRNSSEELRQELTQDFLKAKQRIQENIGADEIVASASEKPKSKKGHDASHGPQNS